MRKMEGNSLSAGSVTRLRLGAVLFLVASALGFLSLASPATPGPKQAATAEKAPKPNITKQPTLYVVGYAHLDTEWRWEYPQVISEFLPKTMHDNFALFEKYPRYIFNWTGANRYMMMKEYYPADFEKIKQYVAAGRWFPAGSSMEENDVNSPSPESIIRQVLYGNDFFRNEFGKASNEYMLPDCFGFPADLPSILAAAGVKGFSTQKLSWGSFEGGGPGSPENTPVGIPFNVGIWIGPDGRSVIAALNPLSYSAPITTDLSKDPDWIKRIEADGKASGITADYHYYGTGDTGGSPDEASVKLLEETLTKGMGVLPPKRSDDDEEEPPAAAPAGPEVRMGEGPIHVVSSNADEMFNDILRLPRSERDRLPTYRGDLELTNHSAGSLTSEAVHKRWNRRNEVLADASEEASVGADWLGGRPYPVGRLNHAWRLVLGGQFHDIMAGTATPESYKYSWNDDVLAMNQFSSVLTSATSAIASGLNTNAQGTPIVVFNPLGISREDVAEAHITFPGGAPKAVRVVGPDGKEVPAQLDGEADGLTKVLFLAKVPSVGFAVYDVMPAENLVISSSLKVTDSSLENERYRIELDKDGDVSSILDKSLKRELLSAPARLAFQTEDPQHWPAWNMDWDDQSKPPRGYVGGPPKIRVVENGPVRVAVQVEREAEGSRFVQTIRLSAGDSGNRIEFANDFDWMTREAALKATFPLTASAPQATYSWGAWTVQRANDGPNTFEYGSHRWFDLTDKSGAFGVTVLSNDKTGSDKPSDNTLRLTLLYTPGITRAGDDYRDQATQDFGHHIFEYGLASHAGSWQQSGTEWQAYRLNQPLITFAAAKHDGAIGKSLSLVHVSNPAMRLMALKKAEDGKDMVVRLVEMNGKPQRAVRISFAAPVTSAREVDGQERAIGGAVVENGELVENFAPFEIRTFEVRLGSPRVKVTPPQWQAVALPYDLAAASDDGAKSAGGFDAAGDALPAEMLPQDIAYAGIHFSLAPAGTALPDALIARGQTLPLPSGNFNRIYILAASDDGDQKATFRAGDRAVELNIQNWNGFIGQWYNRSWKQEPIPPPPEPKPEDTSARAQRIRRHLAYLKEHGPETAPHYAGLTPGFIKSEPVAWFASHYHTPDGGNVPYSYSYLFGYSMDLPPGATTLTLPHNEKIRILAVTAAHVDSEISPAEALYDTPAQVGDPDGFFASQDPLRRK
ncbi:MAG TPA: glycoside hydrolase family 38 C-terminal domain-containing protein [Candidatus Acidoferrales bacterium]|nr:glycoside hydrolase family 38 C-terminal domain-containing protein [Candidatus Acidoferrales bacterium]